MEYSTGSANFSVDQDRCVVNKFAEKAVEEDLYIVNDGFPFIILQVVDEGETIDSKCATFIIKNEDHTLGNLLRYVVTRYSDVEFCGYSMPHPSEAKMHLRIQCSSMKMQVTFLDSSAIGILKKGLFDIQKMCEATRSKFQSQMLEYRNNHNKQLG